MLETKTIDEIINEYYDVAKEYFQLNDLKISKTGVIGFLLYVLGHIKLDNQYYYQSLFKELTPITAQEYSSLLLHASIYGYQPSFANPATYNGNIRIYLPKFNSDILKERTIVIPKGTKFTINDTIWTLDAELTIYETSSNIYATYNYKGNVDKVVPYVNINPNDQSLEYIELPFKYLRQFEEVIDEFTVPYYDYGTFYKYAINLGDQYLANIKVLVKLPNESTFDEFEISFSKFAHTQNDRVVFLSQLSENDYIIEFGNGIYGIYLPINTTVRIIYRKTTGAKANYLNGQLQLNDIITVIENRTNNTSNTYILDKNAVQGEITQPITDGKNIETIDELRRNILNYIKTRNTLVKYDDYKSLLSVLYDYEFIFKKVNFVDNDVYIYGAIYDLYYQPYKTITLTLTEKDFNPDNNSYVLYPKYTYQKQNKIPYPFNTDVYVTKTVQNTNIIPVNTTDVFKVNQEITFNNNLTASYTITDIDSDNKQITLNKNVELVNENSTIQYLDYEKVNLVSPFLYKKDELLNCYKGYYIEDNLISLNIEEVTGRKVPNIYLQIIPNNNFNSITFKVVPYNESLDNYTFQLTIEQLGIYNEILSSSNNFEYQYNITEDAFKKLLQILEIYIDIYSLDWPDRIARLTNRNFKYLYDLSEALLLKLFYKTNDDSTITTYVTQIPFISEEQYNRDKDRIDSKIKTIITTEDLYEHRIPSVQHSFRFYNTLELYPTTNYLIDNIPYEYIDLPLKLRLYIKLDKNQVVVDNLDIYSFINQLKLDLAKLLTDKYTGSNIQYYVSQIEDFVHNYKYVKYVKVITPDFNIVVNDMNEYLKTLLPDKLKIVSFTPAYFWWDINNIDIIYTVE